MFQLAVSVFAQWRSHRFTENAKYGGPQRSPPRRSPISMNRSHLGSPRARLSPGPLQPAGHRAGKTQGQQDTGPASSRVQRLSSSTPRNLRSLPSRIQSVLLTISRSGEADHHVSQCGAGATCWGAFGQARCDPGGATEWGDGACGVFRRGRAGKPRGARSWWNCRVSGHFSHLFLSNGVSTKSY